MIQPKLSGRAALVTGSAQGIGRELLISLAECGTDVAVHYRTSEDAANLIATKARDIGVKATTVSADVTEPDDVAEMFLKVEEVLGTVDILINNVGAFAPYHWTDLSYETWRRVMETNLDGTYLCSREALPAMREQDHGRIVNVGYASGDRSLVSPKNFPYFAAKAGVLMFTRMLAADTQDTDITANAVSPYVVENSDVFPDTLPGGRPASFDDVTQAVLFFLENGSGYLSGQNIEVSGGWLPEKV